MTTLEAPARVHRFSFNSFKAQEAAPAVQQKTQEKAVPKSLEPLLPQAPAITEQELQAAKNEAQAQGHRAGYAEAETKLNKDSALREEAIKGLLDVVANRITIAAETHGTYLKKQQDIMAKMVLAAARKLASEALKREPYASIESLLKECMGLIIGEAKIIVAVPTAKAEGLRQRIDTLRPALQGFEGEIVVKEDADLGEQDCRVEWTSGHAERNEQALWNEIEAIVAKTPITS